MLRNMSWIRVIFVIAGLMGVMAYVMMGGSWGKHGTIAIEFGMYPREFEGLDVEIDGEVAGKLEPFGAMQRTAFAVEEGDHRVRVVHPEFVSETQRVEVGTGRTVLLILDVGGTVTRDGKERTTLVFQ